ncbi:hypothetical protein ACLOJK_024276 [Asimina triloba]
MAPNWEGSYCVTAIVFLGTYKLSHLGSKAERLSGTWHACLADLGDPYLYFNTGDPVDLGDLCLYFNTEDLAALGNPCAKL